jgi:hypothetical protein
VACKVPWDGTRSFTDKKRGFRRMPGIFGTIPLPYRVKERLVAPDEALRVTPDLELNVST